PGFDARRQRPAKLSERLATLRLGVGCDEIAESFDGGEIELAIQERAPGELTGLRRAEAFELAEHAKDGGDDCAAAMEMQCGDIFACFARRRRKPQREPVVECFT